MVRTEAVALKKGSIIFYLGGSLEKGKFNIYNPTTGEGRLGVHDVNVSGSTSKALLAFDKQ